MPDGFEAGGAERADSALQQPRVLEATAGQDDAALVDAFSHGDDSHGETVVQRP